MKKILITGANGQLGRELQKTAPAGLDVIAFTRADLDISNDIDVAAAMEMHQPDVVINAAAYTAVDKAEDDESTAKKVNADGIETLAKLVPVETYLLHISTDFVFDGSKNTPYLVSDETSPSSVYGATKFLGERALYQAKPDNSAIIRTSWVYSSEGKNFVKSMLYYMKERDSLNIVVDQVGTPTWAKGLAQICWLACESKLEGTYHWSDAGLASWYDFAEMIQVLGLETGLLDKAIEINPIPSKDFPLPAKRPAYSVLDKSDILAALPQAKNHHWVHQLREMFQELKK